MKPQTDISFFYGRTKPQGPLGTKAAMKPGNFGSKVWRINPQAEAEVWQVKAKYYKLKYLGLPVFKNFISMIQKFKRQTISTNNLLHRTQGSGLILNAVIHKTQFDHVGCGRFLMT